MTLTLTFHSLSILESQFSKHGGIRPSYEAKAIADCHIPELMKFWEVILGRLKNAWKAIWLDKAILQIFKPLKMVSCSSCDGVPLKSKKKNRRASSLSARIILDYYWPLLEFAGQYR
jgi:hypothetical protein